ncbi:MAG TPA: AraC family transcriptional regulator, partial [Paraburkholderia sp.]|uniref:AraC family transcriptional regulator n=1 Tax=Paraburkholderia sp. TaxID=1926495 RepID=UPI002DE9DEE4|nr:AraC family transcriptional regulator [Paraburkholderia sp.]
KTVAFQCGFHSASHMRTTFSRRLSVTPQQYRQRFRAEMPISEPYANIANTALAA